MKATKWVNRKLVLMVGGPIARTALTVVTGYLTGKGVPPEVVGQLGEAIAVGAAIGFNIAWDLVSKMRAETKGYKTAYADVTSYAQSSQFVDDIRARFDREAG